MNVKAMVSVLIMTVMMWCGALMAAEEVALTGLQTSLEQVDINTADADTLQRVLKGVGRSRAEAIVAYREANGRFYSAEELAAVKGIGQSTVEKNVDRILID